MLLAEGIDYQIKTSTQTMDVIFPVDHLSGSKRLPIQNTRKSHCSCLTRKPLEQSYSSKHTHTHLIQSTWINQSIACLAISCLISRSHSVESSHTSG